MMQITEGEQNMKIINLKNMFHRLRNQHYKSGKYECITYEQALIMALRMHSRGDCSLLRALRTGFELRYQINFLDQLNVSRSELEWLIGKERDILSDWK